MNKYRVSQWFNAKTRTIIYGIEVKFEDDKKWYNLAEDEKPLFYEKRQEALQKVKDLKNEPK